MAQTFLNDDMSWEHLLDEKAQQHTSASRTPGVFIWGYLVLGFGSFFLLISPLSS